jgi:hypothetical protein
MKPAFLLPTLFVSSLAVALSGCGEAVKDDHFAKELKTERTDPDPANPGTVPVRIGELGANFNACNAAGTSRHIDSASGERLQVRAAPFEAAEETGFIPAGARFFICSRSHDQRWLGVVYEEAGTLAPVCSVSRPITARRNYEGPCRSGWVAAAFVKQIAG